MTTRRKTRPPKPQIGDIVLVVWHDAWFDFDHDGKAWRQDFPVKTTGFLVRNDEASISVAGEDLAADGHRAVTHIPCAIIQSIEVLRRTP